MRYKIHNIWYKCYITNNSSSLIELLDDPHTDPRTDVFLMHFRKKGLTDKAGMVEKRSRYLCELVRIVERLSVSVSVEPTMWSSWVRWLDDPELVVSVQKWFGVRYASRVGSELPPEVTNKFWFYLFTVCTALGDEIFYATFIPFWFWNIDGAVGRRVVLVWTIVMYIGICFFNFTISLLNFRFI